MGNVLFYLLISSGIFMLIFNLKQCLIYLDPFSPELRNEAFSQDIMNAILAKIFWYNVFEEDFNITVPARKYNLDEKYCKNNLLKNSNCLKVNLEVNRVESIADPIVPKIPDNYMLECWTTLYGSILFICVFSIIRVSKILYYEKCLGCFLQSEKYHLLLDCNIINLIFLYDIRDQY
jgi:hypothetical protein